MKRFQHRTKKEKFNERKAGKRLQKSKKGLPERYEKEYLEQNLEKCHSMKKMRSKIGK